MRNPLIVIKRCIQTLAAAGLLTRTGQFITGLSKARETIAEEKRERADDKVAAGLERKEAESRRFNSGEMAQDTPYSDY